jgi:hypothetical protein
VNEGLQKFIGPEPVGGYTEVQRTQVLDILPQRFTPAIHFGLGFPF